MSAAPEPQKSRTRRIAGLWLIAAGLIAAALGGALARVSLKGFGVVGVGAIGVSLGIGQLIWPLTQVVMTRGPVPFPVWWRAQPLFCKCWFVLSVVAGCAVTVALLVWK